MQPIKENNELTALHCLYTGTTGSGKTSAVKKMGRILDADQVVFWDPHSDYAQGFRQSKVREYRSFAQFTKALAAGRKTKQGFKISLKVPETRKNFLLFCEIVKGFGNGEHPKLLHVVCEENPQVTESVSREKSVFGWLLTVGRKFGFVIHVVGQRTTEMSKTVISQTPFKWVGMQASKIDIKRMANEIDVSETNIQGLEPLEYYFKSPRVGDVTRGKLRF